MGHIVQAAWSSGATRLRVDLLTGDVDPTPLLVPRVAQSVNREVGCFPQLVVRSQSDMSFVSSAEMIVTVDPVTRRPYRGTGLFESPFTCTVNIVDDRGKLYSYTRSNWWYPENPPRIGLLSRLRRMWSP